jgi:DNA-binding response OmpR family regulator
VIQAKWTAVVLRDLLEAEGLEVALCQSTESAYSAGILNPPDIIIADICVTGDATAISLVKQLREANPDSRAVFISGYALDDLRKLVVGLDWASCVAKPVLFEDIVDELRGEGDLRVQQVTEFRSEVEWVLLCDIGVAIVPINLPIY